MLTSDFYSLAELNAGRMKEPAVPVFLLYFCFSLPPLRGPHAPPFPLEPSPISALFPREARHGEPAAAGVTETLSYRSLYGGPHISLDSSLMLCPTYLKKGHHPCPHTCVRGLGHHSKPCKEALLTWAKSRGVGGDDWKQQEGGRKASVPKHRPKREND